MLRLYKTWARDHAVIRTCWNSFVSSFLLVLACVVLVAIVAPAAPAAPGDPEQAAPPQALWSAFPLNPKGQRLVPGRQQAGPKAPFTPPEKPQVVAETPPEPSRSDLPLLAFVGGAGALILVALVGFAVVRLRDVAGDRRRSAPLWQGTAGIEASPVARLQQYSDVDITLTPPSRPIARDVARRSGGPHRRWHPRTSRELRAIAHRTGRDIWNETAPILVGSAIAIVTAFLVIYLVG